MIPKLNKTAQEWFNRYIRLRDTDEQGYGNCISCNKLLKYGTKEAHAGHYYSVGAHPRMRFNENNTRLQCLRCNHFMNGNLLNYRVGLVRKFGEQFVKDLEIEKGMAERSLFKLGKIELATLILHYKNKCKELEKGKRF